MYNYNGSNTKVLPTLQKSAYELLKSYFNSFSRKLEKLTNLAKSGRMYIRKAKKSTNQIFVGKPEFKHTNNGVYITVYIYNNKDSSYKTTLSSIGSLQNFSSQVPLTSFSLTNKLV